MKASTRYVVTVNPGGWRHEPKPMEFQNWRWARRTARQQCADGPEFNSVHIFKVERASMFRELVAAYTKDGGKVGVTW